MYGKNATIQIFSDALDWETILKSRSDYTYTSYNVQDDGLRSGELRFSISAYDTNQPGFVTEANTVLDIRNYRKDENGDGIYDILDPEIRYQDTFTGTESGIYYLNSSYLGAVNFGTNFNVTRDVGQTYITARINAVVTSSSIQEIAVEESFTVDRNYFSLGWNGHIEYGADNYRVDISNNETGTPHSGSSQITKINENSITLESFPLPDATGRTSYTDITLERKGDLYHKQLVAGGITYYIRIRDTEDSDNDGVPDIGDPTPKSFFSSTQSIGNGWHQHHKFGTFFSFFDNAWCYHTDLGWIYVPSWNDTGTWIFRPDFNGGKFQSYNKLNWIWTTPHIYPHAFSNRLNEWLYIGSEKVFIWSKSSGQWSDFNARLQIDPEEYQNFTDSIPEIIKYIEQERASASNGVYLQTGFMNLHDPSLSLGYKMVFGYIFDLSPFETALQGVAKLGVISHRLQDISPLSTFTQLKDLSLRENDISDLTPLSNLINLEVLDVHWNLVNDTNPLSKLSLLKELDLSGNEIEDISPLSSLLNLKTLNIGSNKIQNLEPLKSLKNLEKLDIAENSFSDLTPLKDLNNLKELNCGFEASTGKLLDFSPLSSLTELEKINVSYYSYRDNNIHSPSEEQLKIIEAILPNVTVLSYFYY
jgi:hypothetical protein